MERVSESDIFAKLSELRKGQLELQVFQQWVEVHSDELRLFVAPGILLNLRRGNKQKVMKAVAKVLPVCFDCDALGDTRGFSSAQENLACAGLVKEYVTKGKLRRIPRPEWFRESPTSFGADGYFECARCGAIWTLVAPERGDNGLWEQLA